MPVIQVEAFDLPIDPEGGSSFVLRDGEGRLLVDSMLLGVRRDLVLFQWLEEPDDAPLVYHFGNVPFTELDWLMPLYQPAKTVFPEDRRKMVNLIKRHCLDCVATLPGRIVEVEFHEGV